MSLAKEINEKLDELLKIESEIKLVNAEITDEEILTNVHTGEKVGKKEVIETAHNMRVQIKEDLSNLTNEGRNVKDIFTNKFYVNDFMQDKICAEEQIEERLNNNKPNNIELN
tara:strand:+ start:575 stop:913 length:339 start_codon:yes stop_codon:yes gene_type:complete